MIGTDQNYLLNLDIKTIMWNPSYNLVKYHIIWCNKVTLLQHPVYGNMDKITFTHIAEKFVGHSQRKGILEQITIQLSHI